MKKQIIKITTLFALFGCQLLPHQSNAQYYINTIAGTGVAGYSGDGGNATAAKLNEPTGIAIQAGIFLYVSEVGNNVVREIQPSGNIISTFAGNGTAGFSGDGGAATAAELNYPWGIFADPSYNIWITDNHNERVREVNNSLGEILTVVGNGTAGFSGDGGNATAAEIDNPAGITLDASGNIYFCDANNYRIREVLSSNNDISTFAGNGTDGYSGDGGQATAAEMAAPTDVTIDGSGNIFFCDDANHVVRKVNTSGVVSTVAGNGTYGYSGDGGQATAAEMEGPQDIAVDGSGNLFIADYSNSTIRKVTASTGVITTIAGTGTAGYSGDYGLATSAKISLPLSIKVDPTGAVYFADYGNNVVRMLTTTYFKVYAVQSTISKCGQGYGAVTATPTGGAPPYTYSWAPSGYTGGTTATYSGLPNGTYTVTVTDNNSHVVTQTINVICHHEGIVGSNAGEFAELKIYPNPTKSSFVIDGTQEGSKIYVYNSLGEQVQMVNVKDITTSVEMANKPDGIYFIRVLNEDGTISTQQKIIKVQ
jgi:hypothetical protein